jgi:hypothetical protein
MVVSSRSDPLPQQGSRKFAFPLAPLGGNSAALSDGRIRPFAEFTTGHSLAKVRQVNLGRGEGRLVSLLEQQVAERRAETRHRVLRAGTLQFDGGSVNCTVSNISNSGAMLNVTSSAGIPERFALILSPRGLRMPCHVVWRQQTLMGIWYDPIWRLGLNLADGTMAFE